MSDISGKQVEAYSSTSEYNIRNLFMQAPALVAILEGREGVCTLLNPLFSALMGGRDIVGKPMREAWPELEGQPYFEIVEGVYDTGEAFHGKEYPATADWNNDGNPTQRFFNFVYAPYINNGKTSGTMVFGFDVTEQVLAREKAEENQIILETIAKVSPVTLWMTDEQGQNTFVNQSWIDWTGVPLEKQLGEGWVSCIIEEDRQRAYSKYLSDVAAQSLFEVEFRIINTEGKVVWCYASGCPWYRPDGSFGGYAGSCIDISERKQAEEQIRYRHALLEARSEASPVAMVVVGAEGKIISFNSRFVSMWGFPADIIESKDDEAALQYALTQLKEPQEFIDRVKYLYTHSEKVENEVIIDEIEFKDGRVYERYARIVRGEDGTYYGWAWFFLDITERKQEEGRMRMVLEALPQMAWTTDAHGLTTYFNKGWYAYTGQSPEEPLGTGYLYVFREQDKAEIFRMWTEAVEKGESFEMEQYYRRYDGEYRWHLTRAVPIKNTKGEVLLWVGTCTDIHEQKLQTESLERKVEERTLELTKANIDLRRSNDELEQFAYIASHDLKEPIRKIQFFSDLLQSPSTKNPEIYIRKIQESTGRMRTLIDDLLDYSRIRKVDNAFRKVDLNKVLDMVREDLELVINEKQATITSEVLPTIKSIPLQMQQLFFNLLNNALKYSKDGIPPRITITVSSTSSTSVGEYPYLDSKRSYYTISIEDNGIGFDPKYTEKVFTIFQRLHSRETYSGTGIGLALCKKVVHNHGGEIYVSSIPGLGSTFYVILPAS
ncbi:PAS domain S-box protein [Telluribacter sp.]|jgi:hypothetical protein|uniref:PAS domain-containing sensor histidine kinase n=1 Tax=Telluribacter sp. TaxID=1978767 RepID=UPI002E0F3414|nr:PAS domain S-box protein [Telluribacter sp.]